MQRHQIIVITTLLFCELAVSSGKAMKQKAYSAIKDHYLLQGQMMEFNGHFVDTSPDYGNTCRILINFSEQGAEYVTVIGEYAPSNTIGEGVYFNATDNTFINVIVKNGQLTIEQEFTDGFSTWTKTLLKLTKLSGKLDATIQQTNSFLFFSDTQEKHCIAPFK
jgi:hypothetical protein